MTFRDWLAAEMEKRQLSRREIARRLAAQHPKGVNVDTTETYRRAIRRYLEVDPQVPTEQTQRAIAAAIGADPSELPSGDDTRRRTWRRRCRRSPGNRRNCRAGLSGR